MAIKTKGTQTTKSKSSATQKEVKLAGEKEIAIATALDEAKKRLYAAVDELFGGNAAEAFFGRVHPFSPVDGNFYCETVLKSVGQFISDQFDVETKKMSARVKQYTNRAERRAKK